VVSFIVLVLQRLKGQSGEAATEGLPRIRQTEPMNANMLTGDFTPELHSGEGLPRNTLKSTKEYS
jgi:hypothetical protein